MSLNQRLRYTLGTSITAFLVIGAIIHTFWGIPSLTLLIDRSYCPAIVWQDVATSYTQLYHQHQRRQLHLKSVILFSSLGEETQPTIPSPQTIQTLTTYGVPDPQRQVNLQKSHPSAKLLSCGIR